MSARNFYVTVQRSYTVIERRVVTVMAGSIDEANLSVGASLVRSPINEPGWRVVPPDVLAREGYWLVKPPLPKVVSELTHD